MQVKTKVTCYYKDRIRKEGSVFDFDENDMDRGRDGKKEPSMPKWAIAFDQPELPTKQSDKMEPTTLHEMAKRSPKVSTPKIQLKQD